mmetsp:Transcript_25529/g.56776  ORF Transcript_25529/g.56776 Transcript_25529/m.56776 type:complete len:222 (+) Transcript_25529:273-938(+)
MDRPMGPFGLGWRIWCQRTRRGCGRRRKRRRRGGVIRLLTADILLLLPLVINIATTTLAIIFLVLLLILVIGGKEQIEAGPASLELGGEEQIGHVLDAIAEGYDVVLPLLDAFGFGWFVLLSHFFCISCDIRTIILLIVLIVLIITTITITTIIIIVHQHHPPSKGSINPGPKPNQRIPTIRSIKLPIPITGIIRLKLERLGDITPPMIFDFACMTTPLRY